MITRLLFASCLFATPAIAQDALYGVQPPPGSGFVRIVNASAGGLTAQSNFGPIQTLGTTGGDRIGRYVVVEGAGQRLLSLAATQDGQTLHTQFHALPNRYETILFRAAPNLSATTVIDHSRFDQSRARLAFYNATPSCTDAQLTLPGKATGPGNSLRVFGNVLPATSAVRSVTPVSATLQAECAGQAGQDIVLPTLIAGNSYSIWLMLPRNQLLAFLTTDATAPYQP